MCDDCALGDLSNVDLTGADDGDVLTLDGTTWVAAAPAGGGGWKDFAQASVTGGNGSAGNTTFAEVTNLADLVLDAAAGDLIAMDWNAITFGPQTFYRVVVVGGTTVVTPAGWYRSTNVTDQGAPTSGTKRFVVQAGDVVAGQITLQLQANGTGNPPIILEGSQFEAVNLGAAA